MFIEEGLQVPEKPFNEVGGKAGTAAPLQIDKAVPKLKVGVAFCITVTFLVKVKPHWLAAGVNL